MRNKKLAIILIFLSFAFYGCNQYERRMIGGWSIEKIELLDSGTETYRISPNTILLNDDKTCRLPRTHISEVDTSHLCGKWYIQKANGSYHLIIESKNELFAGDYIIEQLNLIQAASGGYGDEVYLKSKKLSLICLKQHF